MAPDRAQDRGSRWASVAAWSLAALFAVVFAAVLWFDHQLFTGRFPELTSDGWLGLHGVWLGPFLVFAAVGALIASRRSKHPIGWLMLCAALASGLGEAFRMYAALQIGSSPAEPPTLAQLLKIPAEPITVAGLVLGLVIIPLVFPTGRLLSRRWNVVPWGAGFLLTVFLANSLLSPRLTYAVSVPGQAERIEVFNVANPLSPGWIPEPVVEIPPGVSTILLPVLIVIAGVAVVVRFRRSGGVERQQMKWFVYAAAMVALAAIVQLLLAASSGPMASPLATILLVTGLSAYPVAIGVAILRYRLYEIDRIISRTVSYGLVVAVLAGVYVAGVVGLGAAVTALTGQGDSDLVVAVSTLAAAGLFRPVRSRIQTAVDRRFNRTGYEARQAVEAFTRHVRDEVDLERIRQQVAETAAVATQPTHASVWFAERDGGSP